MASFRALSREGHAAMSMRDSSDRWILIQKNTFTNWVNEQLRVSGIETTEFVKDLEHDFQTGVRLCQLVESLQGKKIGRIIKKPMNHHQELENVTIALNAISNDNVRLVNIGPEDIVNANLKLILGLIWHLILRYQIGKTKFPTKKLMLAWLQAVIPECAVTNFTTDWNSGIALHALIDFCRPGLSPNWRQMSRSDGLNNCKSAMELAKREFDIPLVVRPEDLSGPDLDELSGMTYLSYFMKVDSPGYHATLNMVRRLLKKGTVNNFTTDWSDGRMLCNLCVSLGASIAGYPALTGNAIENQELGIQAGKKLGVEPTLTAKEMCDPKVDHFGIMAYAAYFSRFKPVQSSAEKVVMDVQPKNCYIGITSTFSVRIEDDDLYTSAVRADLKGPDSNPPVTFSWSGRIGTASFTPLETGIHRLNVYCDNQLIVDCPISFKVLADRSKVTFSSIDHCAVGMITELKVNSQFAGQGDVQVEARAPGGRVHNLCTVYRNGDYIINFTPSEVGVWQVSVQYEGDHISGSPFNIKVFDPNAVRVFGLEGGTVGMGLNFTVDTSEAGEGLLRVSVTHDYQQVPAYITHQRAGLYRAGTYKVNVFYSDIEVRGSPYTLDIVDSGRVTVSGDGLSLVPVNRPAKFIVDTQGSSSGSVKVEITGSTKSFMMASRDEAQDVVECDLCQQPVSFFCRRCGVNLCDPCVTIHLRVKSKNGHDIVDYTSKDDDDTCHCDSHPQNDCSAFCKTCKTPICMLCVTIKHKSHEISELSDKIEELLKEIATENDRLQSFKHELERILEHTTKLLSSISSIYQLRKDEVTARGEEWHNEIEKIVKTLHQELDDMQKEHEAVLQNQKEKFEEMVWKVNKINGKTIKLQKSKNVTEMQSFVQVIQKQESLSDVSQYSFPKSYEYKIDEYLENKLKENEVSGGRLLDKPTVTSVINTGFPASKKSENRLYDMVVTYDNKVWMGGANSELKLFDLQGYLHHTVRITVKGLYLCLYNKQVVYSEPLNKSLRMISDTDIMVTMFTTGDWEPYGITSAASSDLLVCLRKDDQNKVVRYSSTGTVLQEIQYDSQCQPLYKEPTYITENVNGDIIVTDWEKNAVIAVDRLGIFRYLYSGKDTKFDVCSVATDFVGHVIVTDYEGDKIHMLNRDGRFLRYIIPEGGLNKPFAVCILGHGEMMVGECKTGIAKKIKYLEE